MTTEHAAMQPGADDAVAPDRERRERRRLLLVALAALLMGMSLVAVVVVVMRGSPSPLPETAAASAPSAASAEPAAPTEPAPDPAPEPVVTPAPGARFARAPAAKRPPKTVVNADDRGVTSDQQRRLDALKRLCDAGTVTKAECASKRQAIFSEQP
jgi:hypothetical protein